VREVQNGSPADRAGLRVGHQIIEVNGKPVTSLAALNQLMAAAPNRRSALTILDNGARRKVTVELVPLGDLNRDLLQQRLGLSTTSLSEAQLISYEAAATGGLLIEQVEKTSPAANAQLQPGMVITAVDGVVVSELVNVSNVLGNKKRGEPVQLTVKVVNRYGNFGRLLSGNVDVPVR
jgi:serine protease Do